MKITLNVDSALLKRVVEATGCKTKTAAIDYALREIDRRERLTKVLSRGTGLSGDELANAFEPSSDPLVLRAAEKSAPYNQII